MALTLLAANNAQTVLAAGINATATTLTVNTGTGNLFPSPVSGTSFFKLTLVDSATGSLSEIVHVTSRSGDTMTIERAQEGTTARIWSANDIAANMLTAGSLQLYAQKDQSLLIENNLSEIADAGPDAVAQTLENLGLAEAGNTSGKLALIGNAKTDNDKCAVIVKTGSNANGKYRIWSDGSIDMWGNSIANVNGDALVNYPITLPGPAQNITTTPLLLSTGTAQPTTSVMVVTDLTTATKATFVVKRSNGTTSADGFYWSVNYAVF